MRLGSHPIRAYPVYLFLECGTSFLLGICYATITVYWVISGRLNPLELLLLGTALELSYFLLQLPTGVLADLVSRRLCTLAGLFIVGLALIMESLSPAFANLIAAQVVLGLGAALNNGAQEAWVAGELAGEFGDDRMTGVYLRATQYGLIATVAGSLLSGVIALAGLNVPLLTGGSLICLLAVGTDIRFPQLGGLHQAMWFSLFACAAALLGLGATELAKRRTERLGPDSVAGGLLALTLAIGAAVLVMATAHAFAVVVAAYVAVSVLRPVLGPLLSGWMVTRIESSVRATALSAKDMFDSAGQIAGGPVIGVVGTLTSIRIALLAGAAALVPAAACVAAATRRIRPRTRGTVAEAEAAGKAGLDLAYPAPDLPG